MHTINMAHATRRHSRAVIDSPIPNTPLHLLQQLAYAWAPLFLVCISGVQFNVVPSLHMAFGTSQDLTTLAVWRVLVMGGLYVPYLAYRDVRAATCTFLACACLLLGLNTYAVLGYVRPLWLDAIWGACLAAFAAAIGPRSYLASAPWLVVVGLTTASAVAKSPGLAAVTLFFQLVWLVYVQTHFRTELRLFGYGGSRARRWALAFGSAVLRLGASFCAAALVGILVVVGVNLLHEQYANFSGLPLCEVPVPVLKPVSEAALAEIVRSHDSVRATGGQHSWTAGSCPREGGVIVSTVELRAIEAVDAPAGPLVRCGAGVTMGTLINFLYNRDLQLEAYWHSDVTVGGAVATGVHHLGKGFLECCVREVVTLDSRGERVAWGAANWSIIPGSIGLVGVIVEVSVTAVPLRSDVETVEVVSWSSHDQFRAEAARVLEEEPRDSVIWVLYKSHQLRIFRKASRLAVNATGPRALVPARTGGILPFARDATAYMASLLQVAHSIFSRTIAAAVDYDIFIDYVMDRFDQFHSGEPHVIEENSEIRASMYKASTYFATIEMSVSAPCAQAEACLNRIVSSTRYMPPVEVRFAQTQPRPFVVSGECVVLFDLSLPVWTLRSMDSFLVRIESACGADKHHAGKAYPSLLRRRSLAAPPPEWEWPAVPASDLVAFCSASSAYDPRGKFIPRTSTTSPC